MASVLSAKHFHDEEAAYEFVEARIWANGRVCPHCGVVDKSGKLQGKSTRIGVYKCYACRKPFTVKVKTIFEDSHVKLHLWLQAIFLICSSKKGISANQLHRTLGVTLKTAWFIGHRIREAMKEGVMGPLGGEGMILEADTTYIGGKEKNKHRNKRVAGNIGGAGKAIVHAIVERDGRVRAHHIPNVNGKTLRPILEKHADKRSSLMTDTAGGYYHVGREFARYETVDHGSGEYVRGDAHSNTVEGYFSILKRGLTGTYHAVSEAHLHRYLAEFSFRYSNRSALGADDVMRAETALLGVVGKRLMYAASR